MVHVHHQNIGNTSISMVHGFHFASCVFISLPEGLARVARGKSPSLATGDPPGPRYTPFLYPVVLRASHVQVKIFIYIYIYIYIHIYMYICVFDMLYTTWCYICAMFNMNRYIYICYTQMRTMVLEYLPT